MDKKIIGVLVIIIAVVVIVALFLNFNVTKVDTDIKMLSNSSLNEDSSIKMQLININKNPMHDKTINIKIIDKKGKIDEYSVKTDKNGKAELKLNNIKSGSYTVNFTYYGEDNFKSCKLSKKIKVNEKVFPEKSNSDEVSYESSSNSASNSESDGYWETSIDAPFEYHTEYDSNGGFRQ